MKVSKANSQNIFEVENIKDSGKLVVHVQRMVPYPVTRRGEQVSIELR